MIKSILLFYLLFSQTLQAQISISSHIMKSGKVWIIITKPYLTGVKIEIKTKGFILNRSFYLKADKLIYVFLQDLNKDGFEEIYLLTKQNMEKRKIMDIVAFSEYGQTIAKKIKISHHKGFYKITNNEFLIQDNKLINTFVYEKIKYEYEYELVKKNKDYFLQPIESKN
jgi:hypothetical protein